MNWFNKAQHRGDLTLVEKIEQDTSGDCLKCEII